MPFVNYGSVLIFQLHLFELIFSVDLPILYKHLMAIVLLFIRESIHTAREKRISINVQNFCLYLKSSSTKNKWIVKICL